jgi:hypothetical protein
MVDGVAEAEALAEVVPTEPLLVATVAGVVAATVVLAYTGALLAGAQVLQYTTLEVVTGLTMVQGQLVMVKVVEAVAV